MCLYSDQLELLALFCLPPVVLRITDCHCSWSVRWSDPHKSIPLTFFHLRRCWTKSKTVGLGMGWINAASEDVNRTWRLQNIARRKQKRGVASQKQTLSGWRYYSEQECHFIGINKALLVNHIRQKHSRAELCQHGCTHSRWKLYLGQGLVMHVRFCKKNPAKRAT